MMTRTERTVDMEINDKGGCEMLRVPCRREIDKGHINDQASKDATTTLSVPRRDIKQGYTTFRRCVQASWL